MSNQKRLSQISFAAVALFAAALPCLEQTESSHRNAIDQVHRAEIATLRNERIAPSTAERKMTSDSNMNAKAARAARDQFNISIAEAMSSAPAFHLNANVSQTNWEKAQRLNSNSEPMSSRRITFVPSLGQKLPD